jgi:hypothetical protein
VIFTGPDAASVNAQFAEREGYEREWANLVDGTYEIVLDADHQDTANAGNLSSVAVDPCCGASATNPHDLFEKLTPSGLNWTSVRLSPPFRH